MRRDQTRPDESQPAARACPSFRSRSLLGVSCSIHLLCYFTAYNLALCTTVYCRACLIPSDITAPRSPLGTRLPFRGLLGALFPFNARL
jgi:hypothetical protein